MISDSLELNDRIETAWEGNVIVEVQAATERVAWVIWSLYLGRSFSGGQRASSNFVRDALRAFNCSVPVNTKSP